jgi:hypothetical protein
MGPEGPQGPQGEVGPAGPAGTAGTFLTIDGQPAPNIFFKSQTGNSDFFIEISTSQPCNLVVFGESRSRPLGGWVGAALRLDGSELSRQLLPIGHSRTIVWLMNTHSRTLRPEDGTVSYEIRDPDGASSDGVILESKYTIIATPL